MTQPKNRKVTVYFTMVKHPTSGWIRCGIPYHTKKAAQSWLSFVKKARRLCQGKISQCTLRYVDGKLTERSVQVLDRKFNMDVPANEVMK